MNESTEKKKMIANTSMNTVKSDSPLIFLMNWARLETVSCCVLWPNSEELSQNQSKEDQGLQY